MVDSRKKSRKKTAVAGARPSRSPARRGTLRLTVILGVLVLVNLYVFLWRDGTSLPQVKAKAATLGEVPLAPPSPAPAPAPEGAPSAPSASAIVEGVVEKNESLGKILRSRAKLSASAADELIRAVAPVFDLKALRVGQPYKIVVGDDGRVDAFELTVSKTVTVRVERDPSTDELAGKKDEAATRIEVREIGGRIDSSLYAAIKTAGEDGALVSFFVDVFAYDIDFYNDTRDGDTFKVVIEKEYKDQEFLRYRRILAAEYAGNAGTFQAFLWTPPGREGKSSARYWDGKGQSIEKSMLKTPLKFSRVSSGFNPKRMHPVLHTTRGHFGTDFAAPTGTPVWAAADGVIVQRGPAGGAGNMVTIRHDNGLTTLYMHLSKFAGGQKVGSRVAAKTVIGYVGTTGLSTGPHLHFGVKKNGAYVDFQKLAPTRSGSVGKKDLPAFQAAIAPYKARIARIPTTPAAPPPAPPAPPGSGATALAAPPS